MTFCTDKNGSQRMHTNDVSDPLSLTLKPPLGLFYLFNYFCGVCSLNGLPSYVIQILMVPRRGLLMTFVIL